MSVWRRWHMDAVTEWRSAACPCLVRFAHGWPREAAHAGGSPAKLFSSYWANVASLSDRERDFFVQCVEYIRYGVDMSPTPSVARTVNRLADVVVAGCVGSGKAAEGVTDTICDVVLMPDGRPCMGWFLDGFELCHYSAVVAAMEERWRVSAGSLWALKERGITAQLNSMTAWNRQESLFGASEGWTAERMRACVSRHVRFADRYTSCTERSIDRTHRLSLSFLSSSTNTTQELFLLALKNCMTSVEELNSKNSNATYSTLCRSFGCLLTLNMPQFVEFRSRVQALGVALCAPKCEDAISQAYQSLVRDALDVVNGRMPAPPASSVCSALTSAVRKLLCDLTDVEKALAWFPRVVALCLVAVTPCGRDEGIRSAVLALPSIEKYLDACEAALLQQHLSFEKPRDVDGEDSSRGDLGLVDSTALDRVLCGEASALILGDDEVAGTGPFCPDISGAWMPGVGFDSSFYVSNLLAACDALAGMLGVTESIQSAQSESQRAVHRFRHKLRVHVLRRFGFVNASKLWGTPFSGRALPFLNALYVSLRPSENIAVFRFRNDAQMPHPFDAVGEPSPLLQSFVTKHLAVPGSSPCFFAECGTVQELRALAAETETETKKTLRCCFAPSASGRIFSLEFVPRDQLFSDLAAAATIRLEKAPESRFVDVAAHVEEGRIVVRLINEPHCL
ncbi:hypothetical protein ECC02_005547 [Trypanosoma cruzi]|uniref:Uncharacterized protein n=3 Tax=Trypanosoma cruzi TaxID=5693 RepID=Q4D089_TRYCC|nr:hypothetical protein, conserved [Trypanosoma cruzi]EAN85944.1 hypothetical protein, conserved [Trypanosoma cruzi]KAF5221485.1 hypothetical protein ECC02_005547 [Trypanosoma cruzi]|eukprot:XP_807795.1 hypothetical protein [Trypanosoma cruzi strain CL Brener]